MPTNVHETLLISTAEMSSGLLCCFCKFEIDKSSIDECDSVKSCPHCGAVLEEEQIFSHNATRNDFPVSQIHRTYGQGFSNLQRARLPTSQITASQRRLTKKIDDICSKLQLPNEIVEQTRCFVLEEVNEHSKFKMNAGKFRMVGGCIYIICRANGMAVTLRKIAEACGCSHFLIGDYVKLIDREFNLYQTPVSPESLIQVACSHLPKSKECEEIALQLCAQSCSAMILRRQPLAQAIAHSVIASLALNKGTKQLDEVKKLCKKMSQESQNAVVHCINALKRYMIKLLEEIPWIDKKYVKMTNVHHYVKDIVKYRQRIGAFAAESDTPSWFHQKEKAILKRKQKIKNALERIKLRKLQGEAENAESSKNNDEPKKSDSSCELASDTDQDSGGTDEEDELDEEDRTIEDLLELGCSPEELEDGYYESVKSTLTTESDILDNEIELYVRTPEEVKTMKRIVDQKDINSASPSKRKRL